MQKAPRCPACRLRLRAYAGRVDGRALYSERCTVCSLLADLKVIEAKVHCRRCPLCSAFVEVRDDGFHCPRCGDFVRSRTTK